MLSASTVTFERATQPSNAVALKYLTDAGRFTATSAEQPLNAPSPTDSTFLPIYKSVRALLPANASAAIFATPSPVFTLLRPAFLKALFAIASTESGILISVRATQPRKLSAAMYVTPSGIVTLASFPAFLNVAVSILFILPTIFKAVIAEFSNEDSPILSSALFSANETCATVAP